MIQRIWSYASYESQALVVAVLAFLFCGAVIMGVM
jgi:hypothetical protein